MGPPCLPARPNRRASNASQVLVSPTKQLDITLVAIAVHHRARVAMLAPFSARILVGLIK